MSGSHLPAHRALTRRPLLICADADRASAYAQRLGLPTGGWDYLAENSTFRLHDTGVQILACDGPLTGATVAWLRRLNVPLDDALVVAPDGSLSPHRTPTSGPADSPPPGGELR